MKTVLLYRPAQDQLCDALLRVGHLAQPILWRANPDVRAGNRCLIYSVSPASSVVGLGTVVTDPFKVMTGEWSNATCVHIRLLAESALPLEDMRKRCSWTALRGNALRATRFGPHGRGYGNSRIIPSPHDERLWDLAMGRVTKRVDA
jgi:hypothetical protein